MPEKSNEPLLPERPRAVLALCLLPVYVFALPNALAYLGFDFYMVNYLYSFVGFALALALFFPFLHRSAAVFAAAPDRAMRALAAGVIIDYGGTYLLCLALLVNGVSVQPFNNELIRLLLRRAPVLMLFFTVIAAPVTEECFFRGALFGTLRKKSRLAAYLITIISFSLLHILPGILSGEWKELYRVFLYVPASAALCYAFDASGSVITSVLLHAAVNAVAYFVNLTA